MENKDRIKFSKTRKHNLKPWNLAINNNFIDEDGLIFVCPYTNSFSKMGWIDQRLLDLVTNS